MDVGFIVGVDVGFIVGVGVGFIVCVGVAFTVGVCVIADTFLLKLAARIITSFMFIAPLLSKSYAATYLESPLTELNALAKITTSFMFTTPSWFMSILTSVDGVERGVEVGVAVGVAVSVAVGVEIDVAVGVGSAGLNFHQFRLNR